MRKLSPSKSSLLLVQAHERVVQQLLDVLPVPRVLLQQLLQETNRLLQHPLREHDLGLDDLDEIGLRLDGEGDTAGHHLETHNADCPQVNLLIVELSTEQLWGHIEGCATECVSHGVAYLRRPSEIAYLGHPIAQHNVLRFDVTVDYPVVMQFAYGLAD